MDRRLWRWQAIVVVVCSLLLAQCSQASEKSVVTFMIFGDPPEQAAYEHVIAGFHESQTEIEVQLAAMPSQQEFMTRLAADFASDAPPDVFLLNYRRIAQFYNRDALEALGPRFEASEQLHEDDYFAVALDAFRDSRGTLVCIPQNISSQVVFYNKDIFDAAGEPYPTDGWRWEDLRQTALRLTLPDSDRDGEPDQHGLGVEPTLIRAASFIWQNGGELVDDASMPTHLTLDTPEAMEALQFLMYLSLVDNVVPNETAEIVQSQGDRFLSGSIAMYINSRRIVPTMRESATFDWDVAPLPAGKQQASVLHSDAYCMASASAVKDAAWQFIEYAVGEEGQRRASELGRTVPSMIRVANSPAFLDPAQPPANARVWLDAEPYLRTLPKLASWGELERVAAVEFEVTFLGHQPLSFAVNHIHEVAGRDFQPIK